MMSGALSRWVEQAAGRKVLLVGDLILDRYLYGDAERISPEAPVPVLRTVDQLEAVGGAANVAVCLRALACDVVCCGIIGTDRHGDVLLSLLQHDGVNGEGIVRSKQRRTTAKTRLVGLAQHRHRQQLIRVDEEDIAPLSAADAERVVATATRLVQSADVVCLEDYDKGVVTAALAAAVVAEARRLGKPVLVDPARLSDFKRYQGAHTLTPNRQELAIAAGVRSLDVEQVDASAQRLLQEAGMDAMVVTLDRDGAMVVRREQAPQHVPTVPRSVYDNTGAGDAVLAMLAAATAAGADLVAATQLANVAGGLEVERFGCVPITSDEILADLRLSSRRNNGKLRSVDELAAELHIRRDRGETVAFTNGCFDILHAGHVDYLQRGRQTASMLVVGLNSDASVRRQGKGADRPLNTFEHRVAVLSALECVDYVVGFEEDTPAALIPKLSPDVLIKGEDWASKGVVGREFVESHGGKVVLVPLVEGLSTTNLVERIRQGVG